MSSTNGSSHFLAMQLIQTFLVPVVVLVAMIYDYWLLAAGIILLLVFRKPGLDLSFALLPFELCQLIHAHLNEKRTVLRDCDMYKLSMLVAMLSNRKKWRGMGTWQSTSRNIQWAAMPRAQQQSYKADIAAEMEKIFTEDMIPTMEDITVLMKASKNSPFQIQIELHEVVAFLDEWRAYLRAHDAAQPMWRLVSASTGTGKANDGSPSVCWTAPDPIASLYETAVTAAITSIRARYEGKTGLLVCAYRVSLMVWRIVTCSMLPPFHCYFFGGRRSSNHLLLALTAYLHARFNRYYAGTSNLGVHLLFFRAFGFEKAHALLKAPAGTVAHQWMMAYQAKDRALDEQVMLPLSQVTAHMDFWLQTGILALLPDCLTSFATAALLRQTKISAVFAAEFKRRWKKQMLKEGTCLMEALQQSGKCVARQDSGVPSDFYTLFPPNFMCMASEISTFGDLYANVVGHGIGLVGCGGYFGAELGISEVAKLVDEDGTKVVKVGDAYRPAKLRPEGTVLKESKFTIDHELDVEEAERIKRHYLQMIDNAYDESYIKQHAEAVNIIMAEAQERLCEGN